MITLFNPFRPVLIAVGAVLVAAGVVDALRAKSTGPLAVSVLGWVLVGVGLNMAQKKEGPDDAGGSREEKV
jgi:hypothetical protein